jgi:PGF-pre-PGF domain-containing protein
VFAIPPEPAKTTSILASLHVNGKNNGLIVTATVLSSLPNGVFPAPGDVFEYVDLVPARYTNITGATVTFTVPLSWLDEHLLSPADIVLYHHTNGTWTALPTIVGTTADGRLPSRRRARVSHSMRYQGSRKQ